MKNSRSNPPIRLFLDDEPVESQIYQKSIGPTPADLLDKFYTCGGLKALTEEEKEILNIILQNNDLQ